MTKVKDKNDKNIALAKREGVVRKEQAILIQAKLITMRNEILSL